MPSSNRWEIIGDMATLSYNGREVVVERGRHKTMQDAIGAWECQERERLLRELRELGHTVDAALNRLLSERS